VNLGQSNEQLTEPQVARAEPQPVDAVRRDLSVSSGTRPARMPEIFGESPRRPAQSRIRRAYSIGPRIAAIAGFAAAVIGAVLLLARPSPIKPNDTITQHDLIPAGTVLTQDMGAQQHVGTQQDVGAQQEVSTQQDVAAHPPAHNGTRAPKETLLFKQLHNKRPLRRRRRRPRSSLPRSPRSPD